MKCIFRSKIYHNEENGYTIAEFWTKDESVPVAAQNKPCKVGWCITVFGYNLPLNENMEVEMVGKWVNHPQYGLQFEVETFMEIVKRTREGIVGYLSSGAIKGIGVKTAEAIFSTFGMDTLAVIEESPEKLLYNVDEYSMVEMKLAYEFFRHLPARSRVVLIGDVDQLPSVGAGDVFRQFIGCGLIPVTVLDLVYRQAQDSLINFNAVQIKQNQTKLRYGEDFQFIECNGADEAATIIHRIYAQEAAVSDVDSVQVLTPFRKKSASGVMELNKKLREIVNPAVSGTM